jgi:hypothetical protein
MFYRGYSLRISGYPLHCCNTCDAIEAESAIECGRRLYFESWKLKIICLGVGV